MRTLPVLLVMALLTTNAWAEGPLQPVPKASAAARRPGTSANDPARPSRRDDAMIAPSPEPRYITPAFQAATPLPPPLPLAPVGGPPLGIASPVAILTDWLPLDPENTLVLETSKGRVVIELRPEFAPLSAARLKRLARSKLYDGLLFHRVIEGFIAQTGNPGNRDGGRSDEPNLPPEFSFRLGAETPRSIVARPQGESAGFIGSSPYISVEEQRMILAPDRRVTAWGAFCAGVVAMGRQSSVDSGNSEFFIMRQTTRSLDRDYSVVGRVVMGLDVVRAFNAGDPPLTPDKIVRARVLADIPEETRPDIRVLNTLSPQFTGLADQVRGLRGADFSVCDVEVPVRYN